MVEFGIFVLNVNALSAFFSQSTASIIFELFAIFGYLIFVYMLLFVALMFYQEYREGKYTKDWEWVVLAVDVPPMNEQTPKAVEALFIHLAGAYSKPDIGEKFRGGYKQRWFSFEIISIEGYIQFLVRTEESFKDLLEAAIYAQYPQAEITEVQDYVDAVPQQYPNDTHDMWAADFGLANDDAYPIRTHKEFEHTAAEEKIKDPMSALLESFSRIGPGEQMWLQILIEPISSSWKEKGIKKIKEVIGDTTGSGKKTFADKVSDAPLKFLENVGDQVFAREAGAGAEVKKEAPNQLQYLTPGQSKVVEAMEEKISMVGFKTKIRGVYVARKEVFRPTRGVNALVGSLYQFNSNSANSFQGTFSSGASYFFKQQREKYRKSLLMKAYKKRKISAPGKPFILNVQELATIWHFPMMTVGAPLLQKVEAKSSEPPTGLPVEHLPVDYGAAGIGAPENLPADHAEAIKEEPKSLTDAYGYSDDMKFG